jgi:hypothetical protein
MTEALGEMSINDDGAMLIRELDHDVLQNGAATTNAALEPRPTRAELFLDPGPGCARLLGGASLADVNRVVL